MEQATTVSSVGPRLSGLKASVGDGVYRWAVCARYASTPQRSAKAFTVGGLRPVRLNAAPVLMISFMKRDAPSGGVEAYCQINGAAGSTAQLPGHLAARTVRGPAPLAGRHRSRAGIAREPPSLAGRHRSRAGIACCPACSRPGLRQDWRHDSTHDWRHGASLVVRTSLPVFVKRPV